MPLTFPRSADDEPFTTLPLEGHRFDVFGSSDFRKKWLMIFRDAGGQYVDSRVRSVDYILSDLFPEDYEIGIAKSKKKPLLSPEWAIQTLIKGEPVDPDDSSDCIFYHWRLSVDLQ
jgi:hypothetical protein